MNYEVKSVTPVSLPFTKYGLSGDTYGVPLSITIGVVGQIYGGFTNTESNHETFCPILRTDGTDAAEAKFAIFAADYVTTKYPNF